MKKVLFVATITEHINSFHIPYLKMFKEKGYEVCVASNGKENINYCDKHFDLPFERSPFKINNIKSLFILKKIMQEENFDIVHCHTPVGAAITRIAAKGVRNKGTRVIYTAHGFHFFKGAPIFNWIVFYPIEKYLSKYTDDLITINKEDYNFAKDKFKKCKSIHYVPGTGVDEKKFDFKMSESDKISLRKSLNLKKDDYVLIYTAELNKNKNQSMIINVMNKLVSENKKYHLILVGSDSLNGYYQNMVKRLKLDNNIHFLGYRNDVNRLLKISNLAISCSQREGLPVNIIEAIISGIPCVVTNCRGNRDLIINEENGYVVEINDIENMYDKIKKISKKSIVKENLRNESFYINNILKIFEKIYFM